MVYQVRGVVLPDREERTLWVDGDRLRTEPVADAEVVVDRGWLLPGLVDVHTHPSTEKPGDPFDEDVMRGHLLPAQAALGAASWTARTWLGLPGLVDGAPADLIAYPTDPTTDPEVVAHPSRIILRGQIIR